MTWTQLVHNSDYDFISRQMFCYSEWTRLLKQREKGVTVRSRGHFRLPECEALPRMAASHANATCTKSGITDMRYDLATSKSRKYFNIAPFFVTVSAK